MGTSSFGKTFREALAIKWGILFIQNLTEPSFSVRVIFHCKKKDFRFLSLKLKTKPFQMSKNLAQ